MNEFNNLDAMMTDEHPNSKCVTGIVSKDALTLNTCQGVDAVMTDEEYQEMKNRFWNAFPDRKNNLGYPLEHCRWEPKVQDFVYVPLDYGTKITYDGTGSTGFCCCCKLQPCIAVEYSDEVYKIYIDMWTDDNQNYGILDVRTAIYDFLARTHCLLFQRPLDYRTFDLPCVVQSLDWSVPYGPDDRRQAINKGAVRYYLQKRTEYKYYQKPIHTTLDVFPPNFMVELTEEDEWYIQLNETGLHRGWRTSRDG
jgi:hypothetical protein